MRTAAMMMLVLIITIIAFATAQSPPVFRIPPCKLGKWSAPQYYLTKTNAGEFLPPTDNTSIAICHTPDGLSVQETAMDNNALSRSNYCNDSVWEDGAALEFFIARIATPYDIPIQYFEIDITPTEAVFGKIINNNKGNVTTCATCTSPDPIPCTGLGKFPEYPTMTNTVAITPTGWTTDRFIPFQIFDKFIAPNNPNKNILFKFNAYRYDYPHGIDEKFTQYELSGVSPTFSGSFHIPARFATLELVDTL